MILEILIAKKCEFITHKNNENLNPPLMKWGHIDSRLYFLVNDR